MEFDFNFDLNFNDDDEVSKEKHHRKFKKYDVETDLESELNKFIDRDFKQRKNVKKQTDTGYYFVMTFQSQEQRDLYLKHNNLLNLLEHNYFISGLKASKLIDLKQDVIELKNERFRKIVDINII